MTTIAAIALFVANAATGEGASKVPLPTEPVRQEHHELQVQLRRLESRLGRLPAATPAECVQLMGETVRYLKDHIGPHAVWEERVLYPMVDQKAGSARQHPFTASMRHEHVVISRWIIQLDRMRGSATEPLKFLRQADKLLGVILAHFEEEEQVLLPILDASMTQDEFKTMMRAGLEHPGGGSAAGRATAGR